MSRTSNLETLGNKLDDDACTDLAGVFKDCPALDELHLSHNWITEKGVEVLTESALENLAERYYRPFWLRVEHNNFSYAARFIADLKAKFHPQICGREDRYSCSNRGCVKDCRIHIPFLVDGKGDKGDRGERGERGRENKDNPSAVPVTGAGATITRIGPRIMINPIKPGKFPGAKVPITTHPLERTGRVSDGACQTATARISRTRSQ